MPTYNQSEIESANNTIKNILNQYNTKSLASEYRADFKKLPYFVKYVPNEYTLPTYARVLLDDAKKLIGVEVQHTVTKKHKNSTHNMWRYGYELMEYERYHLNQFIDNDALDLIRMLYTLRSTLITSNAYEFPIIERFRHFFNVDDFIKQFNLNYDKINDEETRNDVIVNVAYQYLKNNNFDIATNITNYYLGYGKVYTNLKNIDEKRNTLPTHRFFKKIVDVIHNLPNEELIHNMYIYIYEQFRNFILGNNITIKDTNKIFLVNINIWIETSPSNIEMFFKEKINSIVETNDKLGIGQYLFDKYFKKDEYYPSTFGTHKYGRINDDVEKPELNGCVYKFISLGGYRVGVVYLIKNEKYGCMRKYDYHNKYYTGFYPIDSIKNI